MKYVIRSIEKGERIGVEKINEKRAAAREKILAAGFQYLEYEATLGSLDALGHRIEETVHIIEAIVGGVYV